jgi:hypothetical protein
MAKIREDMGGGMFLGPMYRPQVSQISSLEVHWLIFGIFILDLHSMRIVREKMCKKQKTGIKLYLENQVKDLEVLLLFHGECLVQVSALRNPVLNLRARLHTTQNYQKILL